jgi:hypothetical protein
MSVSRFLFESVNNDVACGNEGLQGCRESVLSHYVSRLARISCDFSASGPSQTRTDQSKHEFNLGTVLESSWTEVTSSRTLNSGFKHSQQRVAGCLAEDWAFF